MKKYFYLLVLLFSFLSLNSFCQEVLKTSDPSIFNSSFQKVNNPERSFSYIMDELGQAIMHHSQIEEGEYKYSFTTFPIDYYGTTVRYTDSYFIVKGKLRFASIYRYFIGWKDHLRANVKYREDGFFSSGESHFKASPTEEYAASYQNFYIKSEDEVKFHADGFDSYTGKLLNMDGKWTRDGFVGKAEYKRLINGETSHHRIVLFSKGKILEMDAELYPIFMSFTSMKEAQVAGYSICQANSDMDVLTPINTLTDFHDVASDYSKRAKEAIADPQSMNAIIGNTNSFGYYYYIKNNKATGSNATIALITPVGIHWEYSFFYQACYIFKKNDSIEYMTEDVYEKYKDSGKFSFENNWYGIRRADGVFLSVPKSFYDKKRKEQLLNILNSESFEKMLRDGTFLSKEEWIDTDYLIKVPNLGDLFLSEEEKKLTIEKAKEISNKLGIDAQINQGKSFKEIYSLYEQELNNLKNEFTK
ncbi:MAG: hypothetical protein HUJ95_02885 [Bacteroidales bacterium]|nr:hypothetical protein [Bacteroidales bacterium]